MNTKPNDQDSPVPTALIAEFAALGAENLAAITPVCANAPISTSPAAALSKAPAHRQSNRA